MKFFGLLAKCFQRRFQNWILLVHLNFWRNVFLMKNVLSSNFRQWVTKKRLHSEKFSPGLSTIHSPTKSQRKIWGKVFSLKNLLLNRFLVLNETFPVCFRIDSVNLVKTDFSVGVQKKHLREKIFFEKPTFFCFRTFNENFFGLLSNSFCQSCQNQFFRRSLKNFLVEIPFFIVFGHSMKNLRHFVECISVMMSKLHITSP